MNIEQLKLTIRQQNTPWDDIREKTEKEPGNLRKYKKKLFTKP